jgi:hypothetical protein
MPLKSFLRCFIFLYLSAFSLAAPMELWDIENPIIPENYRISSDASAADVKQDIDISILIGKAHTGLTSTCLGLFFYYHPIDAVPLVPLYLGYSALVYCASSFDNFQTCKTLRHPEAKIALERFIFHQRSQSGFYGLSSMCFFCDAIVNPLLDFPFKHYGAVFVACAAVNSFLFD